MPLTVRLNKILIYAHEEAGRLCNKEVLPEHLLLGIIRLQEGTAYDLLLRTGWSPEDAKLNLDEVLQESSTDILRIADNEAKSYNDEATGSIHLLLAILHERINHAAIYLEATWDITYDRIAELYPKRHVAPQAGTGQSSDVEDEPRKTDTTRLKKERKSPNGTPSLDKYGRDFASQKE